MVMKLENNKNTKMVELEKKYGKELINDVIRLDGLTPSEIEDVEYLEQRIEIHLEWLTNTK
jgi:hypothetical protein